MKIERKIIDTKAERDLIKGMIVSDKFLDAVSHLISIDLFESQYARIISKWCQDHYQQYKQAPNKNIQQIYEDNIDDYDESKQELISDFLDNISEEYTQETFNDDIAIDRAIKFIKLQKLKNHQRQVRQAIKKGDVEKAENLIGKFKKSEKPLNTGKNILTDSSLIINALRRKDNPLIRLPGAIGQLLGDFHRGDFMVFSAPMKRGKTFWLEELAIRCARRGLKVVHFDLEMGEEPATERYYHNFLGEPTREGEIEIPYFDKENEIKYKVIQKEGISVSKALRKAKKLVKLFRTGKIRLISLPARSLNVYEMNKILDNLENYENYIPDVIILDYMDLLVPEPGAPKDKRNQIDDTWQAFRGLTQSRHALGISATQGARATFERDQTQGDTTEDIRKLGHVTKMISLNQTEDEKKDHIMRIGTLVARYNEFFVGDEVIALQHLGIAKPCLDSRWKKDTNL